MVRDTMISCTHVQGVHGLRRKHLNKIVHFSRIVTIQHIRQKTVVWCALCTITVALDSTVGLSEKAPGEELVSPLLAAIFFKNHLFLIESQVISLL